MTDSPPEQQRSLNSDVPAFVQFMNNSGRTVNLFWLDFKGELVRYGLVPSRKAVSMNTYVTHPWVARDADTRSPLLLNGRLIFYPQKERNGVLFHDLYRDQVKIHIPVYSLFRRALETVYLYFSMEDIETLDIPKDLKENIAKLTALSDFRNYAQFESVFYENVPGNNPDLHANDQGHDGDQ